MGWAANPLNPFFRGRRQGHDDDGDDGDDEDDEDEEGGDDTGE